MMGEKKIDLAPEGCYSEVLQARIVGLQDQSAGLELLRDMRKKVCPWLSFCF